MKKVFYLAAVAAFAFFSCQKQEIAPNANTNKSGASFTFKASIEQSATKATINASNQLVWAENDKIGIYVNDASWTDKNQPFTLVGTGGVIQGEFKWDYDGGNFTNKNASAAFFPWEGTGSDKNNVNEGTAYFKLPNHYDSYTSGKMLTPLVAEMSYNSVTSEYEPIQFKHAGAAVKVTINNLPAGAHSIGMKVDGKQIYGDFRVTPNNANPSAIELGADEDVSKNEIWLNYTNDTEAPFTFIFPVPTLTTPKLIFKIYDEHDVLVWEKKLKAQPSDLGRADILDMPAIDITPYAQFNAVSTYYVHGTLNGTDWKDFAMVTDGAKSIAKGLVFSGSGKFKVTDGTNWYPDNNPDHNWNVTTAGTYDIIFDNTTYGISVVASKCPYPVFPVTSSSSTGFTAKEGFDNSGWVLN